MSEDGESAYTSASLPASSAIREAQRAGDLAAIVVVDGEGGDAGGGGTGRHCRIAGESWR